ncbi:hypothetical protein ACVXHA_03345 [Escherichia coli]
MKALRDATRGGVNAVVHGSRQPAVVVLKFQKRHCRLNLLCARFELLGLDALNFADEGKLVIAVERNAAEQVLAALHSHPLGSRR